MTLDTKVFKIIDHSILSELWLVLHSEYFPAHQLLLEYNVLWSARRQKRILASCNLCQKRVRVAQELNHPEYTCWLEPLLYHEMCHAVLEPSALQYKKKTRWHGTEFRKLERRHPKSGDLNQWIKTGGWSQAVRRHRAHLSWHIRNRNLHG